MASVVKSPLVTEKNTIHSAAGVYVFEVTLNADKTSIKAEVEKRFSVKVKSIRTVVCRGRGKITRLGATPTPRWKKAFVKLKEGEKIALFEGA